jgi:hypothetical protein
MVSNLFMDGADVYDSYRVFVTKDGYGGLAAFPALKAVDSNDWAEEDGREYDLSSPVLNTRELSVGFAFHGNSRFGAFVEALSDGAYHDFYFPEIGKEFRLRFVSQSDMSQIASLGTFSLRFADDFPLAGYSYVAPQSNLVPQGAYALDGRYLSEYGVYVLQGGYAELQKLPAAKKNLLQNIGGLSGAIYDGEWVRFQPKDVKLDFLMRASGLQEFRRNHDALLYDLSRPGLRTLSVDSTGVYSCFYKSCSVSTFAPAGKIWFRFAVVLTFTAFGAGMVRNIGS